MLMAGAHIHKEGVSKISIKLGQNNMWDVRESREDCTSALPYLAEEWQGVPEELLLQDQSPSVLYWRFNLVGSLRYGPSYRTALLATMRSGTC